MFAFGVLGKDATLEQLGWLCDRDMACGRFDWARDPIDVRLGVVKLEI